MQPFAVSRKTSGEEKGRRFSPSALSLFRFHLSPFPPETPDTQAIYTVRVAVLSQRRTVLYTPYLLACVVSARRGGARGVSSAKEREWSACSTPIVFSKARCFLKIKIKAGIKLNKDVLISLRLMMLLL